MSCLTAATTVLLVSMPLIGLCSTKDYCMINCRDDFYGRILKHFMCIHSEDGPSTLCLIHAHEHRPLTDADKTYILTDHNQRRNYVALGLEPRGNPGPQASAANMRELVWNGELEAIATRVAMQCNYGQDMAECLNVGGYTVGRNEHLFCDQGDDINALQMQIKSWFDEVALFNRASINRHLTREGDTTKHYTQMVRGDTDQLGCARTRYRHDSNKCDYLVCLYGVVGDLNNRPVYASGDPCGDCENQCSRLYAGLCAPTLTDELQGRKIELRAENPDEDTDDDGDNSGQGGSTSGDGKDPTDEGDGEDHEYNRQHKNSPHVEAILLILLTILL